MIIVEDLIKSFGKQTVLKGVSLQIQPGEKLCIVGGSGSGKSVLVKVIFGLLPADSGTIQVQETDISAASSQEKHRMFEKVGMVFQSAALFDSLTVRENVGIRMIEAGTWSSPHITTAVIQSLEEVGLDAGILHKLPAELSGGMRKRVGIARAIIHKPNYLIYDEPTTGLDPINSAVIDKLIQRLSQDPSRTSLIITHDMQTVRSVADRVAMIHAGKILFHGPKDSFFRSDLAPIQDFLARDRLNQ